MASGWRCHKQLFPWQTPTNTPNRRHMITISANDNGPVESVIYSILEKGQRKVDVGLLLLVPFPLRGVLQRNAIESVTSTSFELGRFRKWARGIQYKQDQGIEIACAVARDFHGRIGTMSRHELAFLNLAHPVRSLLA